MIPLGHAKSLGLVLAHTSARRILREHTTLVTGWDLIFRVVLIAHNFHFENNDTLSLLLYSGSSTLVFPKLTTERLGHFEFKTLLRPSRAVRFQATSIFLATEVFCLTYVWNWHKSHQGRCDSPKTVGKSVLTSSSAIVFQETSNRNRALLFFQNERILQNSRGIERFRMRERTFGHPPAYPVRATHGSPTNQG